MKSEGWSKGLVHPVQCIPRQISGNHHKYSDNKDTNTVELLPTRGVMTKQSKYHHEGGNGRRERRGDEKEGERTTKEEVKLWKSPTDLVKGSKHIPQCNRAGNACCEDRASLWNPLRKCMKLIVTSCCLVNKRRLIDEDKRSGWSQLAFRGRCHFQPASTSSS